MPQDAFGNYDPGLESANIMPPWTVGTGTQQVYSYTNDPNAEGVTPTNTALEAVAYQEDGLGPTYNWDTSLQVWV